MQQLTLLTEMGFTEDANWCSDDWQTPNEIAQLMARLVRPSDRYILEPAAGTGQIVKQIVDASPWSTLHANELSYSRVKQGRINAPSVLWMNLDFLGTDWQLNPHRRELKYDLIITNPPFSKCVEFIERSLQLLNPNNPEARLLFLLPLDWNCPLGRAKAWSKLDAHIHHTYRIKGRVPFLDKDGIPRNDRQCSDAVFDIRLGRSLGADSYLDEVEQWA